MALQNQQNMIISSAEYKGDKRICLTRIWGYNNIITILLFYPSTADARNNDVTIKRCIEIAKHNGYSGIKVYNIEDSVREHIKDRIICVGWGTKINRRKSIDIINILSLSHELLCFTQLVDGRPGLPTRLSYRTVIQPYVNNM